MRIFFCTLAFFMGAITTANSQAYGLVKTEYITPSSFKDENGNSFGSGDLWMLSGRYAFPLATRQNDSGQPIIWSASIYGAYGILTNKDMTEDVNPDKILNTSINLAHLRPISKKWHLMATLGAGIYSAPDAVTAKSILVNGAAIFIYKLRNNLDVGIGLGLTNSYGVPLVMPMSYINWRLSGKYEVKVDITNAMEISGALKLNDDVKLRLVAIEMGGMSSVTNVEGTSMIYATTTMKSYVSPEFKAGKSSTIYLGLGGTWMRPVTFTKRTFKGFWDSMFNDERDLHFGTAGYVTVGFRYGF